MTTDFRALCAELVRIADALDGKAPLVSNQGQALDGYSALAAFRDVAHRARAALAKPEPEGPTVMEIIELADEIEAAELGQVDLVRAALARWRNHQEILDGSTPQPVPVSERLPGLGDCDAQGMCWWWYPEVPGKTYGYWAHEDNAVPERALDEQPSHWLPVHALPLPVEVQS